MFCEPPKASSHLWRYDGFDKGALLSGYTNLGVAKRLLERGLSGLDGVVFLDDSDKKMILLRAGSKLVPLEQAPVPWDRRLTFYDQVHTTGGLYICSFIPPLTELARATALLSTALGENLFRSPATRTASSVDGSMHSIGLPPCFSCTATITFHLCTRT